MPSHVLLQWADTLEVWQTADLDIRNSRYHEGEVVPFMLRLGRALPDTVYTIRISHGCVQERGYGYDSLMSYERDRGFAPALHEYGPGTSVPDAASAVADDTHPRGDSQGTPAFQLWGGVFEVSPESHSHGGSCVQSGDQPPDASYTVAIRSKAEDLYLLWGGHLALRVESEGGERTDHAGTLSGSLPPPESHTNVAEQYVAIRTDAIRFRSGTEVD